MRTWMIIGFLAVCPLVPGVAGAQTGQISGRVTDAAGTALQNVSVTAHQRTTSGGYVSVTSQPTDASGNYTLTGLSAGTYYLKTSNSSGYFDELYDDVACPGYRTVEDCPPSTGVSVSHGATTPNIDFALALGGRISGRVTPTGGFPGVSVSVYQKTSSGFYPVASGTADWNSGTYITREPLATGTYYVKTDNMLGLVDEAYGNVPCVTAIDYCDGARGVSVTQGATTANIDFALARGGSITGRVTDLAGAVLPSAFVFVSQKTSSGSYASVTYGEGGYYGTERGLPSGTFYLQTENFDGYVNEVYNDVPCVTSIEDCPGATGVTVTAGANTPNINFALAPGGRVSGRVTDTVGTGLSGVQVEIYQKTSQQRMSRLEVADTDANGYYTFHGIHPITSGGLPPGTYYLRTSNSVGYLDEAYNDVPCVTDIDNCAGSTPVSVTQGATTPNIDFALAVGGRISGRVTDGAGVGVGGVTVQVYQKTSTGSYVRVTTSASSDAAGTYITRGGLPTGTYYLQTYNRAGYVDEAYNDVPCITSIDACVGLWPVSVTQGATTPNIDFALARRGRISGRVTDTEGAGLSGVEIEVYHKTSSGSYDYVEVVRTDTSGGYVTTAGLATGSYYVRTSNVAGYLDELYEDLPCPKGSCPPFEAATAVSVTAGTTTSINFALAPWLVLPAGDFDGDGRSDVAVFRPSTGVWFIIQSSTGTAVGVSWGQSGDVPVPGDYDGDGKTDVAVFRPSSGMWYVLPTTTGTAVGAVWGVAGDVPVPGDYDGDGKTDVAVFRPSSGVWYIIRSTTGMVYAVSWGQAGDVPVPADFDGDRKADPTLFRPDTGTWYELRSTTGSGFGLVWGQGGDVPLAGDYDGDGKADPTVFRGNSNMWYELRSTTGVGFGVMWGTATDIPIVGDYEGDGKMDPTVFRPSTSTWYEFRSTTGVGYGVVWGATGDLPL